MYAETTVVVDGAVEEEQTFFDQALLDEYVTSIEDEARGHGYPTELYVMYHEHEHGIDCECAQYVTDHHPAHAWNVAD